MMGDWFGMSADVVLFWMVAIPLMAFAVDKILEDK